MIEVPRRVAELDWGAWEPRDRATLVFVRRGDELLLIRKLRGLGAGKINGPGGRIEPGESAYECAARELHEELGVAPVGLRVAGELAFQFRDGYSIHATVFLADDCLGVPHATDEAVPRWTAIDAIPYAEMWADDALWLPLLLDGIPFRGRFVFDGDEMLDHEVAKTATPELAQLDGRSRTGSAST